MLSRLTFMLRVAAFTAVVSGLIGGAVWFTDIVDRSDGDDLRWGFWHNPLMNFTPFHEPTLEASMWVLFCCAALSGLGGLLLSASVGVGRLLVTWQASVSIVTNSVVVVAFLWAAAGDPQIYWMTTALVLRLGSIAINGALWWFLTHREVVRHLSCAVSSQS